jgi:uncharacterized protein YbjT (DUF2867 family)
MSFLLEHAFEDLMVDQVFLRPGFYFSNWLIHAETARNEGILPTFFPVDLPLHMISPLEVAREASRLMIAQEPWTGTFELVAQGGPYTSQDVAEAYSALFGRKVEARQTPRDQWDEVLRKQGLTPDAIRQFSRMSEIVAEGSVNPEGRHAVLIEGKTGISEYFEVVLGKGDSRKSWAA